MATALLPRTEPAVMHPRWSVGREERPTGVNNTRDIELARGLMLEELAGIPAARRKLLGLAEAVRTGTVPAGALVDGAGCGAPNIASVKQVIRTLERVRELDARLALLRVRASAHRTAGQILACHEETARLTAQVARIVRELPICRAVVRTLANEQLTLDDELARASSRLLGPGDIDRIHAVERRVGLRAEPFRQRCVRLRRAAARMAVVETPGTETFLDISKGRPLCVSERQ